MHRGTPPRPGKGKRNDQVILLTRNSVIRRDGDNSRYGNHIYQNLSKVPRSAAGQQDDFLAIDPVIER